MTTNDGRICYERLEDFEGIRAGDLPDYCIGSTGIVVIVLEKWDAMVVTTESGCSGKIRWGEQYPSRK